MPIILKIKIHRHSGVVLYCVLVLCRQVLWNRGIGLELCDCQVNPRVRVELSLDGEGGGRQGHLGRINCILSFGTVRSLSLYFPHLIWMQEGELSFNIRIGWRWVVGGIIGILGKILGRRVGGVVGREVWVRWGRVGGKCVLAERGIGEVCCMIRVELRRDGGKVLR